MYIIKDGFRKRRLRFSFDMLAWFLVCETNGVEIGELDKVEENKLFDDFLFCAARSYLMQRGKRVRFTREQLLGWVDKMTRGDARRLEKEIMQSRVMGQKTLEEYAEEGKKKR
jgi:hypothetical protein